MDVKLCWCVPEGKLVLMFGNPCNWPKCINGQKPDPETMRKDGNEESHQ